MHLKELQYWTNQAVIWVHLMLSIHVTISFYFRANNFLVEGALELRIVSVASAERPEYHPLILREQIKLRPARMQILARTAGSRAIGGKAYRCSLGYACTMASRPSAAGGVRVNQMGQWVVFLEANSSTSALSCRMDFTT